VHSLSYNRHCPYMQTRCKKPFLQKS